MLVHNGLVWLVANLKEEIMITNKELEKAQNIIKQHEIEQLRLSRVSNRSCCSKCGKSLSTRWEESACHIKLEIGIDCCST